MTLHYMCPDINEFSVEVQKGTLIGTSYLVVHQNVSESKTWYILYFQ